MSSINEAKRLVKRALLANITTTKRDLTITPLVSGKHGVGKSQMIKSIASDLGGVCITIEGGTLKEGEITGLPYQYRDEDGSVKFRFLPYYAVDRIQNEERRIFEVRNLATDARGCLAGDENRYALNDLSPQEKLAALLSGEVKPAIIFIDEINRTENTVYRELMNILLTRSVNGYQFPWWVFFVGAMNPSTLGSMYATNEMDPAQLDRFLKIKVGSDVRGWISYGKKAGISSEILDFIKDNPKCLSDSARGLEDEEKPTPSPRGWEMVDILLASEPMLRPFFTEKENRPATVEKDMKELVGAKLGSSVATMFFASRVSQAKALAPEFILEGCDDLEALSDAVALLTPAKMTQTCDLLLEYLKDNIDFMTLDADGFSDAKRRVASFVGMLDAPNRLLFAQKIASATTVEGSSLIELLFDVFERDLVAMLDLSDATRKAIEAS